MSKLLRGVTAQLLLLTVLPLTVILGVISFGSITMHQQAMRLLVSERDIRSVASTASAIGVTLQHKMDVLDDLAEAAREAQTKAVTGTLTIGGYLSDDSTDEFPGGVALYGASGELVGHSRIAAGWAESLTLTSTLWSSTTEDGRVGVWGDSLFLRVQDRTGTVTAVGLLPVKALQFSTLINPLGEGSVVDAALFGPDGRAIVHTQPSRVNTDISQHPGVAEALQGQRGGVYRPDPASGEEHVVSYAPIVTARGETGLGIILEEPWETVLDPLMRYSLAAPLITLPVLLLAMLAVAFGLRRIVQPLQQLDQQARAIGTGDYGALSRPVRGIEEIEQLQTTLRAMAHQIQTDQERLRNYAHAVTETQEAERKRLARELHDDTIQNLIVLSQRIQVMRLNVAREQSQIASRLEDLRGVVLQMIEDVRRFSRALRPIYLEDAGLAAALDRLVCEANATVQKNPPANGMPACTVTFTMSGQIPRLKPDVELALFRIAQEALTNALRHASPTRISITLDALPDGNVQLRVEDDGRGFAEPAGSANGHTRVAGQPAGGFGLIGIRERALLIGADVDIDSQLGKGTCIAVTYHA